MEDTGGIIQEGGYRREYTGGSIQNKEYKREDT